MSSSRTDQENESKPAPGNWRVKSLDHVTIVVKDLERSRHFYTRVLGMREVPRPAFSFAGLWFQAGATQIHLILEYAGSGPAGNLSPESRRHGRSHHFAFEVEDAAATLAWLEENQVAFQGPKLRPDGCVQIFVHDPDGHVVELCSPPKR
jgi:catechol 2,3-dioxygenase-like lactoylglutathione lyase family enzyme